MEERRFSSRTPEDISCIVLYNGDYYDCNVIDISREGMALNSDSLYPTVDEALTIFFDDKHNNTFYGVLEYSAELCAIVQHVTISNNVYRIGVHIVDEDFIKYVDRKQAHLWFKKNISV